MIKRSITINGHHTSISLEDVFWDALKELAHRRRISVTALVAEIDHARTKTLLSPAPKAVTYGLSSMIRIYILKAACKGELRQNPVGQN